MDTSLFIKSYKKHFEHSYAFGATLVFYLLRSKPEYARLIYVHSSFTANESYEKLCSICRNLGVEITVSDKLVSRLSPKENVYVIGVFEKFTSSLEDSSFHVLLDNPSNSGNVGTIMRTMLGFNVKDLAIIRPGLDVFDPKTVRSSMGAIFDLRTEYFDSYEEYAQKHPDRDLFPFMLGEDCYLDQTEIDRSHKITLAFGNEATGLPEKYKTIGSPVMIRSSDAVDSFNLSIAAAIGLYEFTKGTF